MNRFKPEQNLLAKVGSSLNFKHSKQTLDKLKSRKLSAEALSNLKTLYYRNRGWNFFQDDILLP